MDAGASIRLTTLQLRDLAARELGGSTMVQPYIRMRTRAWLDYAPNQYSLRTRSRGPQRRAANIQTLETRGWAVESIPLGCPRMPKDARTSSGGKGDVAAPADFDLRPQAFLGVFGV